MNQPHRIALVGNDTGIGKTAVAVALLRAARRRGLDALPYKPLESADAGPWDSERLCAAIARDDASHFTARRISSPVAPGLAAAEDIERARGEAPPTHTPLAEVCGHQAALIAREAPALLLVETAGGLFVPMPGGTWQPQWIRALADAVVLVIGLRLGAIHQAIATQRGLEREGIATIGWLGSSPTPIPALHTLDADVITHATGLRHFGTLVGATDDRDLGDHWLDDALWAAIERVPPRGHPREPTGA
jgi:dethiobiotin synthetase